MADRGSKAQHLAVALDLFDELGPPAAMEVFKVSDLADAAGVHRATLYRHWATNAELHDDLLQWGAMERPGWQRRILEQPPELDLTDALTRALGEVADDQMIAVRAAVTGFPDRPSSQAFARWERAWLDAFGGWLAGHLHARGRRPRAGSTAFDAALAVAALVEGALVLGSLHDGPAMSGWNDEQTRDVVAGAVGIVRRLTEAGSADPADPGPAAPPLPRVDDWPEAKRAIVARLLDTEPPGPILVSLPPEPARLVDFRLLSARAEVSVRRLYALWPTATSFNADLVEVVYRREAAESEGAVTAALGASLADPDADLVDLLIDMLDTIIRTCAAHGHSSRYACIGAMADVATRHRGRDVFDESVEAVKVSTLALLQTLRHGIRAPLDADRFTWSLTNATLGAQRLVTVHPDLLDVTVPHREDGSILSVSLAALHILGAATEPR